MAEADWASDATKDTNASPFGGKLLTKFVVVGTDLPSLTSDEEDDDSEDSDDDDEDEDDDAASCFASPGIAEFSGYFYSGYCSISGSDYFSASHISSVSVLSLLFLCSYTASFWTFSYMISSFCEAFSDYSNLLGKLFFGVLLPAS